MQVLPRLENDGERFDVLSKKSTIDMMVSSLQIYSSGLNCKMQMDLLPCTNGGSGASQSVNSAHTVAQKPAQLLIITYTFLSENEYIHRYISSPLLKLLPRPISRF